MRQSTKLRYVTLINLLNENLLKMQQLHKFNVAFYSSKETKISLYLLYNSVSQMISPFSGFIFLRKMIKLLVSFIFLAGNIQSAYDELMFDW